MMRPRRADQPRDLFESSEAPTQLCDQHKHRLMQLVQAMLLEILPPMTSKEVSGDEGQL
jgi:hypothetical protein